MNASSNAGEINKWEETKVLNSCDIDFMWNAYWNLDTQCTIQIERKDIYHSCISDWWLKLYH